MARITQGITSASFKPADYATDDLETAQGYRGVNVQVEGNDGGVRETVRTLPKSLDTSPLTKPNHGAGKGNVSTRSQRPGRPGKVGTGR